MKSLLLALIAARIVLAQAPASERHEFTIANFRTESGVTLPKATVVYGTYGQLNAAHDNAVLLPSHYMANFHGYEWLIGPGRALDPSKLFLVATELFGNGRSSSPSNTPEPYHGPRFPVMTIRDNVEAVHRLLTEDLKIAHLRAVVGFSMGAQQAFQWAVSYPAFADRIVATSGTAKTYPHGYVRLEGQIAALTADAAFQGGDYTTPPAKGLEAFGTVWAAWLYSQEWWRRELWRTNTQPGTTFDQVMDRFRKRFIPGADANDIILQARTWEKHDVGTSAGFNGDVEKALRSIKAPLLYMPSETDLYFPVGDARYEAQFIPGVTLTPIPSLWGHTAGAASNPADGKFLNDHIGSFLNGTTNVAFRFAEHTIATDLRGGYQVVVADLNHDGRPDLIALAQGLTELVWYENPTWERHVIAGGQSRMINCVAVGADRDGIPDIVLATGFANEPKKSLGIVSVLRHNGDPRGPWTATEIDRIPSSHRLRLADIDGSGRLVVLNSALAAADAVPPDYRGDAPLVYYRPGEWKRQTIAPANQGLVHGILVLDWDGRGRDSILTAGFEGIHRFEPGKDGNWMRTRVAEGDAAPWPKSGSSDVAVGKLANERFLAAIEPWHGNQVAIYRRAGEAWKREVIDTTLVDGHTIQTGDFHGDGNDEVVAGYRGQGRSVNLYYAAGGGWSKQVLDAGGMGAASCAVADLNGDGRRDIACIGSATANLKWYENLGK